MMVLVIAVAALIAIGGFVSWVGAKAEDGPANPDEDPYAAPMRAAGWVADDRDTDAWG